MTIAVTGANGSIGGQVLAALLAAGATAIAKGEVAVVSGDVHAVTGHEARGFEEFLRERPDTWAHLARSIGSQLSADDLPEQ